MSDLVVYYSRSGTTKKIAQIIADKKDAKIVEITEDAKRGGAFGFIKGAVDSVRSKSTNIKYENVNLKDYDKVYLGTPVWASKPTPAVVKFIEENDFGGVNTVTFATMKSSGDKTTISIMNNMIISKGGNVTHSFAIADKKDQLEQLTLQALDEE